MMAVMTYRVSIAAVMYNVSFYPKSYVKLFVTCTAATLNLMVIVILNKVLHKRRSVMMEIHYVTPFLAFYLVCLPVRQHFDMTNMRPSFPFLSLLNKLLKHTYKVRVCIMIYEFQCILSSSNNKSIFRKYFVNIKSYTRYCLVHKQEKKLSKVSIYW